MSMAMKYGMMQRAKGGCSGPDCTGCSAPSCMAGGGAAGESPAPDGEAGEEGIVDRIMQRFAKGGAVEPVADFASNDFDELDQIPENNEADYTGANSGDELGDKAVEDEDEDTVAKVMKSRKKGDRMPRPA